jgi:hypothetical protein
VEATVEHPTSLQPNLNVRESRAKTNHILKMEEGDSLSEHLLKIIDIHDKLLAIGREVMEYDVVVVTLKSIPPSFEKCVETLNVAPESTDMYFEKLCIESR